jgi:hypothetical protein
LGSCGYLEGGEKMTSEQGGARQKHWMKVKNRVHPAIERGELFAK